MNLYVACIHTNTESAMRTYLSKAERTGFFRNAKFHCRVLVEVSDIISSMYRQCLPANIILQIRVRVYVICARAFTLYACAYTLYARVRIRYMMLYPRVRIRFMRVLR